jgi:hypothetical protein
MNMSVGGLQKQHENWKAARERLFNPAVKVKIADIVERPAKPIIAISAPEPIKIPPLWKYAETHFDWHVRVWRETIDATISTLAHENAALRAALQIADIDIGSGMTIRRPVKEIVEEVLENFPGITWEDIKGQHRSVDVVYPRHLCMYQVFTQRRDMSYPRIAKVFGGRDHTTVISAVVKISGMDSEDHRKALERQRKFCKKRRKYARDRIRELEAAAAQ